MRVINLQEWVRFVQKENYLYHITNIRNLESILTSGLRPNSGMKWQRGSWNTSGIYLTNDVEWTLRGLTIDGLELNNLVLLAVPLTERLKANLYIDLEYSRDWELFFRSVTDMIRYMKENPLRYVDSKLDYTRRLCKEKSVDFRDAVRFLESLKNCPAFYSMGSINPRDIIVVGKLGVTRLEPDEFDDDYYDYDDGDSFTNDYDYDDYSEEELESDENDRYEADIKFKKHVGKSVRKAVSGDIKKAVEAKYKVAESNRYFSSSDSRASNHLYIRRDRITGNKKESD